MKKASFWLDTPYTPREALNQDLEVDVVIVGGGITGVSALYHASQLGFKTALVERGEIAGGAAGKNGGMIVEGMAVDLLESIELFGEQTSIDIWKSSEIARKIILDIVDKHKIDCELTSGGSLYISNTKEDDAWLESENKVRNNHGFSSKFLKPGEQFKSSPFSGSLFNPQDSGINPVKFLRSLAKICELSGAKIFENTEALALNANSITTKNGVIRAKYVISAVESSMKDADTVMVDSIGLMTEPLSSDVLSRLDWKYGEMLWTTGTHYICVKKFQDRLFLNGDDETATLDRFFEYFPLIQRNEITISHSWRGQICYPKSHRPTIRRRDGIYEVFGQGGNGLTFGVISGKYVIDMIIGKKIPTTFDMLK